MKSILLSVVFLFIQLLAIAQQARVKKYTTPLMGHVVLADVPDKYSVNIVALEMPDPDDAEASGELKTVKEKISALYPRQPQAKFKAQNKKTSALPPIVDVNYVSDSMPGIPPDNYVGVNKQNQAVSVMNTIISVHNAQTGQITTRKGLKQFSLPVGLNNIITDNRYDPKIMYDPEADRFICIMLNGVNQANWVVVGFSTSSDPTGGWNFYKFYGDFANDTTFFDYPSISITKNEFFFTGNKVMDNISWQTGFKESVIYQVRKQDGYNGDTTLTYQLWDSITYNGNYVRNLYPVKGGASLKGPTQYFVENKLLDVQNDTTFLVKLPDTIGSANNNLVVTPLVSNISYGVPPDGRQPDTSVTLMTNDGRVLGGYAEGSEIQFVSTTVNTTTGASGIYHGIISNYDTNPALQASIYTIDTLDFGYPNISYAGNQGGNNQSIISFDYTGPSTYPGYAAIFYDGSQYSDMVNIKSGAGSIKQLAQKEQRWGDYSGSQPDWSASESVWVAGIYGRSDKKYGNYMARLLSPYYTSIPVVNSENNPSLLYPNPGWQFVNFEFETKEEGVVNFVIYNMQGQVVDKLLSNYCEKGRNRIQFNIAPLAGGMYILKGMDERGKAIYTHSFVKK